MKIENKSARLVHLNVPGGVIPVPPLGSVELSGEQASAAKAILDGPWKPLVEDGSLVVDGKARHADPPQIAGEPSPAVPPPPGSTPTVVVPPTPAVPTHSSGFGSDVDRRDVDSIPSKPPSRR